MRNLWKEVNQKALELGVDRPKLGRKRRATARYVETASNTYHEQTVEELYRKQYFEIVDKLIAEIELRFQSPTFILYSRVEEVFRKATFRENTSTDLQEIIDHYWDDLQGSELYTELSMFKTPWKASTISLFLV